MAKCIYCDNETKMYQNDQPICANCADRMDAGEQLTIRKQPASERVLKKNDHI